LEVHDVQNKEDKLIMMFATLENERDAFKDKVAMLEKERDGLKEDMDMKMVLKNSLFEKERDDFKCKIATLEKERNDLKEDRDSIKTKLSVLTSKLRDQVECPVCLEVPTSGPIHCCPNGHFVCSNCKEFHCPSCRCRMFSGKSLLAVTIIDNIEHKCRNEECGELLPLAEYKIHLKCCPHRVVSCPAPSELCGKKVSLSKLYDHILSECDGSMNKNLNSIFNNTAIILHDRRGIPVQTGSRHGLALDWNEVKFYLSMEKANDCAVFSVQLLESGVECTDYEATITVYRADDLKTEGKHVHRLVLEPLPVDIEEEERKKNGLMVSFRMLEKITMKDEDGEKWSIAVRVDFNK